MGDDRALQVRVAVEDVAAVCRAVIDGVSPVPIEVASSTAKLVSRAFGQGGSGARFSDNGDVVVILALLGRSAELLGRLGREDLVAELDRLAAAAIWCGQHGVMMTFPLLRCARAVLVRARR